MKKLPLTPAETRRNELNQSATDLAKERFSDSEHRRLYDAKQKKLKAMLRKASDLSFGIAIMILWAAIWAYAATQV